MKSVATGCAEPGGEDDRRLREEIAKFIRLMLVQHAAEKSLGDQLASLPEKDVPMSLAPFRAAMAQLRQLDPGLAELLALRFLEGLTVEEVAQRVGRPRRTIQREIVFAQSWLRRNLESGNPPPTGPSPPAA